MKFKDFRAQLEILALKSEGGNSGVLLTINANEVQNFWMED